MPVSQALPVWPGSLRQSWSRRPCQKLLQVSQVQPVLLLRSCLSSWHSWPMLLPVSQARLELLDLPLVRHSCLKLLRALQVLPELPLLPQVWLPCLKQKPELLEWLVLLPRSSPWP